MDGVCVTGWEQLNGGERERERDRSVKKSRR